METVKLIVGLAGVLLTVRFGIRIMVRLLRGNMIEKAPSWFVAIGCVAMTWGLFL